jgi:serine/threonine protein kinase
LSTIDPSISPALAQVIQHCLEKEPDQRFQSARDLAFALRRLTGSSTTGTPLIAPRRARRRIVVAAVALAALITAGTTAWTWRVPVVDPQPSFKQLTFRRGHIDTARFAPDGQTVISSASWDGCSFEMSSTRLDSVESTRLPVAGDLLAVSMSGIALIVKKDILATVPMGGSGVREVLNRAQVPAQIFRIDPTTGRCTFWRDAPYPDPASIEPPSPRLYMSADGSKLVYSYQCHLSELYLATGLR